MENRFGLSQLYAPPTGKEVTAHIVFVHGLFGHPRKTWSAKLPPSKSSKPTQSEGESPHNQEKYGGEGSKNRYMCWPESLLPGIIPDTRILTFGFDADVDGFLSSASQNTIHQHAQNLLSDLADLRNTPEDQAIPIVFVVHSLGGIIVKDALNQSSSTVGTRLKEICPAVIGVCFLGTPHRGSKAASMGKMAYNLTVVLSKRPNLRLLQGLKRNSETLDRVGDTFSQTLIKHHIAIYSFREEKETRKYLLFNTMVVNGDSAKIGDGKEEIGSIPADHSHMTKFESASDVGFKRVSAQLRRWVEKVRVLDATPTQDREDCMNSLNDKNTRARLLQVDPAHKKTFHWLFDPQIVSFTGWLRDTDVTKSPIYWIQGKPGSGKSTMMKFAMRDVRILESLNADTGDTWTLAAFFFHDRGSEMQKTLVGMLQGILHSILDQLPALLPFVVPSYIYLVREQRTRIPDWDLDQLLCTFRFIFEQREVPVRILFLLDALDEHHGDNETLISLIKELTDKTDGDYVAIKWCLASRSWTIFAEHFGNCPGFLIHDYTKQDVRTYVESQLNYSSHGQQSPPDQDRLAAIINTVTRKALGVFIWVRIVVDRIAKGLRDGTPYTTLETQVEEMPQQLSELYADTLKRVEPEYATEAYIMLQIAFCSLRPLPLESFMASLVYNYERLRQPTVYDIEIARDPVFIPHEDPGHQLRMIASRSGGLLETVVTVSTSADVDQEDGTSTLFVQFIHQTVKEYVQRRQDHLGLVDVLPTVLRENGNSFLLRSCEISSDERICCIKKDMFIYAKFAEDTMAGVTTVISWMSGGKPRTVRVTSAIIEHIFTSRGLFDIAWWVRENPFNLMYPQDLELGGMYEFGLGLAVAANLLHYINDAYINSTAPENLSVRLLCIAAAGLDIDTGSRKVDIDRMIRSILVKRPATIHQDIAKINSWSWRVLSEKENITARHSRGFLVDKRLEILNKPLPWMIQCQALSRRNEDTRLSVARTLLQSGADANDLLYENGYRACSLVEYCVRYESAGFVRLLFEYGADPGPNWATLGRWPLLRFARIRQDEEILQALRDFGFDDDTSVTDDTDRAPSWSAFVACGLMLAASSGGVSAAVTLSGSRNGRDQFRLSY